MEPDVSSLPSDVKSEADSDRELVPDLESIKGSQGSGKIPLVGPGRGSKDPVKGIPKPEHPKSPVPKAVNPSDLLRESSVPSVKEESVPSEKSALSTSGLESQGVKPKDVSNQTPADKDFLLRRPFQKG